MILGCETVSDDKTFANGDDGTVCVATAEVQFTIPPDVFRIGDILCILRNTASAVTIAAGTGVTILSPSLTVSRDKGFVSICKIDNNMWIAWGDL